MTSNIDFTKPTAVVAFTEDVRQNFKTAYDEITALQNLTGPIPSQISSILSLISGLNAAVPGGSQGSIQFNNSGQFAGNSNFTVDPTTTAMFVSMANNAYSVIESTQNNQPALSLVSQPGVYASEGQWTVTETDDLTGAFTKSAFYASLWSRRTITTGKNAQRPGDGGISTGHYGLIHDVMSTGSHGDAGAIFHNIAMMGIADSRQDTTGFEYFHNIDTAGTAYSSITEGTQVVTSTAAPTVAGGGLPTTMVGHANHLSVANSAIANMSTYYYMFVTNDSQPAYPSAAYYATSLILLGGNWSQLFRAGTVAIGTIGHDLYTGIGWGGGLDLQGSISGTTLTVSGGGFGAAGIAGKFHVGDIVSGPGVTPGTVISSLGTGLGGAGTYNLNQASTVTNQQITSGSGAVPVLRMSRMSLIDFCGEVPGQYYMKTSTSADELDIVANGSLALALRSGSGGTLVSIPTQTTDKSVNLAVGLMSLLNNSLVGYPSIGYNVKAGTGANSWRYIAADKVCWLQFNTEEFWFWANDSGTAGTPDAVINTELIAKIARNGINITSGGSLFLTGGGSFPNKSIKVGSNSNLQFIASDFTTVLASIGENGGVPSLNLPAANSVIVINNNQVLGDRLTGWPSQSAPPSTADIGASPTNAQLASLLSALIGACQTQGFIGA